jgi:hypothetical protein
MSFDIIIDWEPYKTDFNGHEITMELLPLKSWASILLTPIYLKTAQKAKHKKKIELELAREIKISEYNDPGQDKLKRENIKTNIKNITADDINFAFEVQEIGKKILPVHVRNICGLSVNKLAVTNEMLCEETVFAPLAMDIIAELSSRSQLKPAEAKN